MAVRSSPQDPDRETKTPAYRVLQNHSEDARDALRAGFRSVDELMLWFLDVSKYTLGWVPNEFAPSVLTDPYTVRALVRPADVESGPPAEQRKQELIESVIVPAFNSTRGWLRGRAQDHDSKVDADRQAHTGLLPRVDHVAGVQRRAIEAALDVDDSLARTNHNGPIRNRRDVSDWVNDVNYATQGFTPGDLVDEVQTLGSDWRFSLTKTRGMALRIRLALDLFPPMNSAIYHAAESGMEQAEKQRPGDSEASIS
jgi:hypothetical protein